MAVFKNPLKKQFVRAGNKYFVMKTRPPKGSTESRPHGTYFPIWGMGVLEYGHIQSWANISSIWILAAPLGNLYITYRLVVLI